MKYFLKNPKIWEYIKSFDGWGSSCGSSWLLVLPLKFPFEVENPKLIREKGLFFTATLFKTLEAKRILIQKINKIYKLIFFYFKKNLKTHENVKIFVQNYHSLLKTLLLLKAIKIPNIFQISFTAPYKIFQLNPLKLPATPIFPA